MSTPETAPEAAETRPPLSGPSNAENAAPRGQRTSAKAPVADQGTAEAVHRMISAELARRGWTRRTLAARMGQSVQTVGTLMTGSFDGTAARRRLENALGLSIWSTPDEFEARQKIILFYKADLSTLSIRALNAVLKQHRLAAALPSRIRPRAALIEALTRYALSNS